MADTKKETGNNTVSKEIQVSEVADDGTDIIEDVIKTTTLVVGSLGYVENDKKILWVLSEEPQDKALIINRKSNTVACECELEEIGVIYDGKMVYMGDFSGFRVSGEYSACIDDIEQPFIIDNSLYDREREKQLATLELQDVEDVQDEYYRLAVMMLMDSLYEDSGIDVEYIEKHIHRIIDTEIAANEKLLVAGVLAQFYSIYKNDYQDMANQALNVAESIYVDGNYEESSGEFADDVPSDIRLYATTELYIATGADLYRADIDILDDLIKNTDGNDYCLIADMTYLLSKRRMDYDRCEQLLNKYINRAAQISELSSKNGSYVYVNANSLESALLLEDAAVLGIVNYVLSGGEYGVSQKNYIQYMYGRNIEGRDRIGNEAISVRERALLALSLNM